MRIVLDLQACQSPSRLRGIGRYSMALAKALLRRPGGHEIIVALNGALPGPIDGIIAELDGLIDRRQVATWSQPGNVGFLTGDSRWRIHAAERIRERFLESLAPDVVHVGSLFEGIGDDVSTTVGEGVRLPTAVTLYDLIPLADEGFFGQNQALADWYSRKLVSLRRADMMLAISEYSRREALDLLGVPETRIATISSAADPMFRPPLPGGAQAEEAALRRRYGISRPYVLYNGTIEPHKNVARLLEAFARLPAALRRAHQIVLVCSLHPADEVRLKGMAKQAGLSRDEYVITGFVPDGDLVALYGHCRLFAFPSLREGFGLPALEAMACGAPVVASNTTSLPEVVGWPDALFDPESVGSISGKLAEALGSPGFREGLTRHGLERARGFGWDETARKALAAFEELHERRRPLPSVFQLPGGPLPRLALVSPLPPVGGTIGERTAALLPDLLRHYRIECVTGQATVDQPFVRANLPVRSPSWFERNAARYDRVVYAFGADPRCLGWMPDLIRHIPGIVILHDFNVGRSLAGSADGAPPVDWLRELYRSHGWTAILDIGTPDGLRAPGGYPCTGGTIAHAQGVITLDATHRADAEAWFGAGVSEDWILIDGDAASSPAERADRFRDAIETIHAASPVTRLDRLADDLAGIAPQDGPTRADWQAVIRCIARNRRSRGAIRQLMIDVSELVQRDAGTGIQRVTKNILMKCMENPPPGYRVEPVYDDGSGTLRYARGLAVRMIGGFDPALADDPVDTVPGDIFLGVDLIAHQIEGRRDLNQDLRHRGIRTYYVVYDLLPLIRPEWFPPFPQFRTWLQRIGSEADGLVCISKAVADQLVEHLPDLGIDRPGPLRIGHFHLGADIGTSDGVPSPEVERVLGSGNPLFLVVGTVEPRKGHAQALAAFERLWALDVEAELVIVGKQGWMVEKVADRMRGHDEAGKRLHWFERATDADLNALYARCSALLAVSLDEGFGLPLIEAARHGQPILARDIPVFREIAGRHAEYFSGTEPRDLAEAISAWIRRRSAGGVATSDGMPWLTWAQSARQLLGTVLDGTWDAVVGPGRDGVAEHGAVSAEVA